MHSNKKDVNNIYGRVMPRVNTRSRTSVDSRSLVTRHKKSDKISSSGEGAKVSSLNLSSGVVSELPTMLDDYEPTARSVRSAKTSNVVKPRRTVKSLDVSKVAAKVPALMRNSRVSHIRSRGSAQSVIDRGTDSWTDQQSKTCYSSRSHTKLREIQEEISSYRETEKQMRLRARLYKKCGVVLDDVGNIKQDKSVQAKCDNDQQSRHQESPTSQDCVRHNIMSDQQMKVALPQYPIDRYLDDRDGKLNVEPIIPKDIWNVEPALRPEDEVILRQLHDMLKHTAEDLKILSSELNQYREPKVQVQSDPIPLDEEFNQKIHIEEVVSAKIHGNKILESNKSNVFPNPNQNVAVKPNKPQVIPITNQPKPVFPKKVRTKDLTVTKVKSLVIESDPKKKDTLSNVSDSKKNIESVAEYSFKYEAKEPSCVRFETFTVQHMPSINIRSELKEQKVLHLDINPDEDNNANIEAIDRNVGVIELEHPTSFKNVNRIVTAKTPVRKVSKLSACESSESANNISSDTQHRLLTQKNLESIIRTSPKTSARSMKSTNKFKKDNALPKKSHNYLNEWKKKLNSVYGSALSPTYKKHQLKSNHKKDTNAKSIKPEKNAGLNNKEYIPYSKLTLGGVRLSDIEREVSDSPIKNDVPLSPIIDKILSSKENSPRKSKKTSPRILTTSDENLLQEVLDIEKQVQKTVAKAVIKKEKTSSKEFQKDNNLNASKENDSYDDDFEDIEKTESINSDSRETVKSSAKVDSDRSGLDSEEEESKDHKNETFTKLSNLSMKDTVDIYEFVHFVENSKKATQNKTDRAPKETQTSPKETSIQPIHNDLWSTIDPKHEVEKLFQIEKDLIKKLIVEEYGDLIESNIAKPSTSKSGNYVSLQKNTQTSPAHVKNTMTSPTMTKTRTTSPLCINMKDIHTSPFTFVIQQEETKIEIEFTEPEDLASSVNLSSPRFSLRLPQTSRDVLSNLESTGKTVIKSVKEKSNKVRVTSSSSEVESSSDLSSLGEIKFNLKERLRKNRRLSAQTSESSTTSSDFPSGSILPLRSEGEVSFGLHLGDKRRNDAPKNDDNSLGQL